MKRCISCFRYCENWSDAKEKGMELRPHDTVMVGNYHYKPRKGIKAGCISVKNCKKEIRANHTACDAHEYRLVWNIKTWWCWRFVPTILMLYRRYIRVPIGGLRKPVPLEWQDSFDGMADRVIPDGEPVCPHCGEMPYSEEQCVFCGQRFLPDKSRRDKTATQRERREGELIMFMDGICPECGYSCGNGGYGPLRCRCGWVGEDLSEEAKKDIDKLFAEEFGEES